MTWSAWRISIRALTAGTSWPISVRAGPLPEISTSTRTRSPAKLSTRVPSSPRTPASSGSTLESCSSSASSSSIVRQPNAAFAASVAWPGTGSIAVTARRSSSSSSSSRSA
jgi:hypothetical protein